VFCVVPCDVLLLHVTSSSPRSLCCVYKATVHVVFVLDDKGSWEVFVDKVIDRRTDGQSVYRALPEAAGCGAGQCSGAPCMVVPTICLLPHYIGKS
jgi:hypothetical protein